MKALVIGSGAGGAAAAQVLSHEMGVTVLERGPAIKTCSTTDLAAKYYEILKGGDVEVWQTLCQGGSTMVALGNAVRTLEKELGRLGIDLEDEFAYLENEMGVVEMPMDAMGSTTIKLMEAARDAGYGPLPMPKAIDFTKCTGCGRCAFGCTRGARWDSRRLLEGVRVEEGYQVERVLVEGGKAVGVQAVKGGARIKISADLVVLSAGAIHTPRILNNTGIEAGGTLFVDPFVTVGGVLPDARQEQEVPMAFYADLGDVVISPHYSVFLGEGLNHSRTQDLAGLMVKIKDDMEGNVTTDGIRKTLNPGDREKLDKGVQAARDILERAGAKGSAVTHVRGVHQGGTYPMGPEGFGTKIEGLYVADASLLPEAPGKPPMLTIMALARKVARTALEAL